MSTEEQPAPAPGGVPNSFGNALAWKWTRQMPTAVRRSGLPTLLYALRAMANAAGELRFADRKAIRIQDIAKAACSDEKDARRYMEAAIRAGVITVRGERRRGVANLYALTLCPFPDWDAAADYLKSTARKPGKRGTAWRTGESSGDRDPNQFGGPRPELEPESEDEVRGTAPRMSSGDRAPNGSGDRAPNNPGVTQEGSQDGAGSVSQRKLVEPPGSQNPELDQDQNHHDEPPAADSVTRCTECGWHLAPDPRRPGRTAHTACLKRSERTAS